MTPDIGYKETALLPQWDKGPQTAIHSQHRSTEKTILKYYLEFYCITLFTITSLIHLHDQTLYIWSQIDTISIRNYEEHRTLWQSHFATGWSCLTHISAVVLCFAHWNSIGFLVNRYWSTGLLPFEEFSPERIHEGEIISSDQQWEVITGSDWTWLLLDD